MNGSSDRTDPSAQGADSELLPDAPGVAGKWMAGILSVALITAISSPIVQNWRKNPVDSFPLSYYPMFSEKREATSRVTYIVGIDAKGKRHKIRYTYAGEGGLNQVRRQIGKIIEKGDADKLCESIARKVAQRRQGTLSKVVSVEIWTGTYNLDDYFTGKSKTPVKEKLRSSCRVNRDS